MKITKKTTKAVIAIIALIAIVASITIPMLRKPTNANGYTDVSTEDWYYPAVEYMSTNGYMNGYSVTKFAPYDTLSRAMFVTVLYRVSGEKVNADVTKFTDVKQGTWYTEAVTWAVQNGITSGTSATTFSPEAPVTREQMAVFIKRYIDAKGVKMPEALIVGSPSDMCVTSEWSKDAVQMAYNFGILLKSNDKVNPKCNATRMDAVVAFYNFHYSCGKMEDGYLLQNHIHNWVTSEGTGHMEQVQVGTEQVLVRNEKRQYYECLGCGAHHYSYEEHEAHNDPNSTSFSPNCAFARYLIQTEYVPVYEEQPVYENRWVEDTPATTVCSICGKQQ